ncbi:MAG: cyclic nucleotide-binding protein [Proteobacteria bacterium]|nr:MAG: cyclic nucleotide-binding protein [Pseudomonadota bacterium]
MSIEDDIGLLAQVPTFRVLGGEPLRMLAIGAELRTFAAGDVLFQAGEAADAGYVVRSGSLRITSGRHETIAGPGALIGELALVVGTPRPGAAVALDRAEVLRIARSLFQRVLESDPEAARRLRDEFMVRSSQAISDLTLVGGRLL